MTGRAAHLANGLRCVHCERDHELVDGLYVCASCGANLLVQYDWARARERLTRERLAADADRTLWRYAPLLPVAGRLEGPP
ncbi:MAG TPA: hypothetical protein DFS52_01565, partial [Myxococcales bacterium]|nr:hypothetical protein [Myxococcales bacterium]